MASSTSRRRLRSRLRSSDPLSCERSLTANRRLHRLPRSVSYDEVGREWVGRLFAWRQQADHVVAARCGKRAVERDQATAMSARQPEEIPVRNLFPCACSAHFRHDRGRNGIGPEHVVTAGGGEQQESIRSRLRRPRSARQLRADTNDAELGDGAGRPTVLTDSCREPVPRSRVMLVLGYEQSHQHVYVEKTDHGRR